MPVVRRAARAVWWRGGGLTEQMMELEDLEAVGVVALVRAADRFDASRGAPLVAWLAQRVRYAMVDEVRSVIGKRAANSGRVVGGAATQARMRDVRFPRSLDAESANQEWSLKRAIANEAEAPPTAAAESAERGRRVRAAMDALPGRWATIARYRYLEERPMLWIGEQLGVTESRISQLLKKIDLALPGLLIQAGALSA